MMSAVHSRSAAKIFFRTSLDSAWARLAASAHVTRRSTTSTEITPAALNSSARTGAKSGRAIVTSLRKFSRHGFTSSNRAANNRASSAEGIVSSANSAGAGRMVSRSSVWTDSAAYSGLSITDVTHDLNFAQASRVAAPGGGALPQLATIKAINATLLCPRRSFRCMTGRLRLLTRITPQFPSLIKQIRLADEERQKQLTRNRPFPHHFTTHTPVRNPPCGGLK
jgi:hypothetical protein